MKLSPPKNITFWIAVILGILGILGAYGVLPFLASFGLLLLIAGFVLLLLGNVVKGL